MRGAKQRKPVTLRLYFTEDEEEEEEEDEDEDDDEDNDERTQKTENGKSRTDG